MAAATATTASASLSKDEKTALHRFIRSMVCENKVISNTFTFSVSPTSKDLLWIEGAMKVIDNLFYTYMPTLQFSYTIDGKNLTASCVEKTPKNNVAYVLDDIDAIIEIISLSKDVHHPRSFLLCKAVYND